MPGSLTGVQEGAADATMEFTTTLATRQNLV